MNVTPAMLLGAVLVIWYLMGSGAPTVPSCPQVPQTHSAPSTPLTPLEK